MCLVTEEKHIQDLFADTLAWFVQKNPFRIHKLCTDLCSMARKSNTKVHNTSTHLVKGHNPYCSWWPTHNYLSVKTDRKCILCDFTQWFLNKKKQLFGLGKCSFWPINWQFFHGALKTTKFTNFHRPHSVFTDFQGLEKLVPFPKLLSLISLMVSVDVKHYIYLHLLFPNFQRPCKPSLAKFIALVRVGLILSFKNLQFVWKQFQIAMNDSHHRTGNPHFLWQPSGGLLRWLF